MELKVLFFRYKMLCDKTWPNWVGMPKEGLRELLKVIVLNTWRLFAIVLLQFDSSVIFVLKWLFFSTVSLLSVT